MYVAYKLCMIILYLIYFYVLLYAFPTRHHSVPVIEVAHHMIPDSCLLSTAAKIAPITFRYNKNASNKTFSQLLGYFTNAKGLHSFGLYTSRVLCKVISWYRTITAGQYTNYNERVQSDMQKCVHVCVCTCECV